MCSSITCEIARFGFFHFKTVDTSRGSNGYMVGILGYYMSLNLHELWRGMVTTSDISPASKTVTCPFFRPMSLGLR